MTDREGNQDRVTQDWSALDNYFPEALWGQAERGVPDNDRLREWVDVALELGLRHPSEQTLHRLVSLYLLANRQERNICFMDPTQKAVVAHIAKGMFKAMAKREGRKPCLVRLPEDPGELLRWEETRGLLADKPRGPPVRCPFTPLAVQGMMISFPVRLRRPVASPAVHTASGAGFDCLAALQQLFQVQQGPAALPGFQLLGPRASGPPVVPRPTGGALGGPQRALTADGWWALPGPGGAGEGEAPGAEAPAQAGAAQAQGEAAQGPAAVLQVDAGGEEAGTPDAVPGPARTPEAAAGEMLAALKKRPAGCGKGAAVRTDAEARAPGPAAKRARRPHLPEEGAKVDFMGGTIRRKATCFFLRIPKELSGGPREWTVERRFRGDVNSAWEKALQTLEAKLGG